MVDAVTWFSGRSKRFIFALLLYSIHHPVT
jgi:hypothetical protein